jgi:hypothetical protein
VFLDEAQPVISQITKLRTTGKPVWQPIHFDGFNTLLPSLQNSRSVMYLLGLEFNYALHVVDRERAMRAIEAMQNCIDAYDFTFCYVAKLINIACVQQQYMAIRASLASSIWTEEDLSRLMALVKQPPDVQSEWKDTMDGELAMAMHSDLNDLMYFDSQSQRFVSDTRWLLSQGWKLPSVRKYVWDQTQKFRNMADEGLDGLSDRTAKAETSLVAEANGSWNGTMLMLASGSRSSVAKAFEGHDMLRRLTLSSIAMKRYRMEKGQWPSKLDDLAAYGLSERDWQEKSGSPFGYHIEEDGKAALLWSYNTMQMKRMDLETLRDEIEQQKQPSDWARITAP